MSVLALLVACSESTSPLICPDEVPLAIVAEVTDSVTEANVIGGKGTARRGAYEEAMSGGGSNSGFFAKGNGPGLYEVEIEHPEYQTWHDDEIIVEEGGVCYDVKTTELEVRLQPL